MSQPNRPRRLSSLSWWRTGICLLALFLPVILLADRPSRGAAQGAPDAPYPYGFIDQERGTYLLIQLTANTPDYGYFSVALPGIGLITNTAPAQISAADPAAVQVTYSGSAALDSAAILDPVSTIFTRLSGQRSAVTIQLTATLNPAQNTGTTSLNYGGQQYEVSATPPAHTAEPVFTQIVAAFTQQDWAQLYSYVDRQWRAAVPQADFVARLTAAFPAYGTLSNVSVLAAPDYLTVREGYQVATGLVELTFTANGTSTIQWSYLVLVADAGQWRLSTFVPVPADTLAVTAGGSYTVAEGQSVAVAATALNPTGGTLTYAWDLDNNGTFETSGQQVTFSAATLDGPATRTIVVRVTSSTGATASGQTTITVANAAPTATLATPASVTAGQNFTLSLTSAQDVAADQPTLQFAFDCGDGAGYGPLDSAASRTCPTAAGQTGTRTVRGKVRDKDGGETGYAAAVAVVAPNLAPVVGTIAVPAAPAARGTASAVSAPFTDPNPGDTHTATWAWGDGTTSAGAVGESGGAGSVTGSHTYAAPGVYTVALTVADQGGATGSATATDYLVVYDPDGGFVTGGGWITAPAGACQQADLCGPASGKATFGLNAKYPPQGGVPTGNTEYQVGTFRLQSTGYDWLVVTGATAQVRGTATINGAGSYAFLLTVGDAAAGGGADTFRLKVWDAATGAVVYDTQPGAADTAAPATSLGGGAVVIHQP